MKKQTLMVATFCLAIGLAGNRANAQAGGVLAKVPFNFVVSGEILPAGEYTLIARSHQVNIQDSHGKTIAIVLADEVSGHTDGENGKVRFRCYGDRCFLAELWSPAIENGRHLPISRLEADFAKESTGKYFALLGNKPQR